jgi:hypothetical protein
MDPAADPADLSARLNPGPHHRHLDGLVGRWKSAITVWPRPEAEGNSSEGVSDLRWILNGRWLLQDYRASDSGQEGTEGLGLIGYDPVQLEHVYIWVDNMSCSPLQSKGRCGEDGRTTSLAGLHGNPVSGESDRPFRWVVRWIDGNRWTLELFDRASDGREFRKIEIVNTRMPAPPGTTG